ncbi:cyclic nucleotide phosphodiesterase [Holotrichia oblita]|uniref:Cyclic nucleotide phosphodiesterase n=1 Tax=Holotrichia oblita TaxID=644536 RepID=A0ACB9T4E7_HOLOL|nr:cyclic nucleotide phosphodiesterase [Holotrichia oblita]
MQYREASHADAAAEGTGDPLGIGKSVGHDNFGTFDYQHFLVAGGNESREYSCFFELVIVDECKDVSHLERIVERPGKVIERQGPLNRMQSDTVSPEDMRESGLRTPCTFTTIFELRAPGTQTLVSRPSQFDLKTSTLAQIAGYAAATGQILNIGDVAAWLNEQHSEGDAESARTILCMPIINGQKTLIGVAQLINKTNGTPFTDCDVSLFEAFAIFCGLGIHNTQMYENACKLMAKQKVALECLSYHATASNDVTVKLAKEDIPTAECYNLYSFSFIDFELNDEDTCKATIRMFLELNLVQEYHIPYEALSPEDYRKVMKIVESAILSTDLAMYFKKKTKFLELVDNGEFDWQSDEKKELLSGMMMTACDVSAIAKPWDVQHRVAKMVADEFFDQGDLEKLQLKEQPIAMMDRERKDELPQMQVGFIDVICLPLYKVLSETFPWVQPLYIGTLENRQHWQDLAEKVEMGLTWIDHDTIDNPVEAFHRSGGLHAKNET